MIFVSKITVISDDVNFRQPSYVLGDVFNIYVSYNDAFVQNMFSF